MKNQPSWFQIQETYIQKSWTASASTEPKMMGDDHGVLCPDFKAFVLYKQCNQGSRRGCYWVVNLFPDPREAIGIRPLDSCPTFWKSLNMDSRNKLHQ